MILVQFFRSGLLLSTGLLTLLTSPSATATEPKPAVHWKHDAIRLAVDTSVDALGAGAYDAVVAAVSAWQVSTRGLPTLVVTQTEHSRVGYTRSGHNTNVVRFAAEGSRLAGKALAVTIVTSDARTGEILDADIVVNGRYRFELVEDDQGGDYDFQNVLTHELGHLLGLPEEHVDERATMFATSRPGETHKRDLNATDERAIATLYPILPEEQAGAPGAGAGCGEASITGRSPSQPWASAALVAGLLLLRWRRGACHANARARWGTLAVLGCLTCGAATASNTRPAAEPPSTGALTVVDVVSSWDDGVLWSDVTLRRNDCAEGLAATTECAPIVRRVPGGQRDGVRQQVGLLKPLELGDQLALTAPSTDVHSTPRRVGSRPKLDG